MKIIALGHQQQAGKSTLASFLITVLRVRYPGLKIKQASFASGLKDISHELFGYLGVKNADYYEQHYEEKANILPCGKTVRDIWIHVGDGMRAINKSVWIQKALKSDCDILIISDLRFVDEAKAIEAIGGCCVKVNRDVPRGNNPAETSLLGYGNWCKEIDNTGTLKDLYTKAEELADYLKEELNA